MEKFRKQKNKENMSGIVSISSIFKVKKCLFDQTLFKNTESNSPKPGQQVTAASPTPTKSPKSFFEDSPFSLFKIKKKKHVLQSKDLNSSNDSISCVLATTPTNNKSKAKQKEVSPQEVSDYLQNSSYIQWAVEKSLLNADLIGDFSKPCVLPIIMGRHPDLKTISPETMADLLQGTETINFFIIDCRYPYEFNAGHIQDAQNIYIKEEIGTMFLNHSKTVEKTESKEVLIFYCEFSSERGPSMLRYLRNMDRTMNQECYPFLYYPELYILEGGYKAFFASFKELCQPQEYKTMLDKDSSQELAFYKNECKSRGRRSKCIKRARSSVLF